MTNLVLHRDRANTLVEMARSHVADGSICDLETPALLRRIAADELGEAVVLGVVVVTAFPFHAHPPDDFALVEYEARPGVRNYRLARVPRNDATSIRIGAFERAFHRACVLISRRILDALRGPMPLPPQPGPALRLRLGAEDPDRAALVAGPSSC